MIQIDLLWTILWESKETLNALSESLGLIVIWFRMIAPCRAGKSDRQTGSRLVQWHQRLFEVVFDSFMISGKEGIKWSHRPNGVSRDCLSKVARNKPNQLLRAVAGGELPNNCVVVFKGGIAWQTCLYFQKSPGSWPPSMNSLAGAYFDGRDHNPEGSTNVYSTSLILPQAIWLASNVGWLEDAGVIIWPARFNESLNISF